MSEQEEISQRGTPVDPSTSEHRKRLDEIKRYSAKAQAELKARDEINTHYSAVEDAEKELQDIFKNSKKISVNRTQFYDGRYRDYSTVEPNLTNEESARVSALKKTILESHKKVAAAYSRLKEIPESIPNKAMGIAGTAAPMFDVHRYMTGGFDTSTGQTYYPSEIHKDEAGNARPMGVISEMARLHPDNAAQHPEVTDEERFNFNPRWFNNVKPMPKGQKENKTSSINLKSGTFWTT